MDGESGDPRLFWGVLWVCPDPGPRLLPVRIMLLKREGRGGMGHFKGKTSENDRKTQLWRRLSREPLRDRWIST